MATIRKIPNSALDEAFASGHVSSYGTSQVHPETSVISFDNGLELQLTPSPHGWTVEIACNNKHCRHLTPKDFPDIFGHPNGGRSTIHKDKLSSVLVSVGNIDVDELVIQSMMPESVTVVVDRPRAVRRSTVDRYLSSPHRSWDSLGSELARPIRTCSAYDEYWSYY